MFKVYGFWFPGAEAFHCIKVEPDLATSTYTLFLWSHFKISFLKVKKLDKENMNVERDSGQRCALPKHSEGELRDEKLTTPEGESGRDYRERKQRC